MFVLKPVVISQMALSVVLLCTAQNTSWVVNLPSAPMSLEGKVPTGFILKNTSGKPVVSFTLGCVVVKKEKPSIVSTFPAQEFSIDPGGSFSRAVWDADYVDEYHDCVIQEKAKLALISVGFQDKTSWRFSEPVAEVKH